MFMNVTGPTAEKTLSPLLLLRAGVAVAALLLTLGLTVGQVPPYAGAFGAFTLAAAYFSDRRSGRKSISAIAAAAGCAALAGAALIANTGIVTQLGRIFNTVSDEWLVRFGQLTPLVCAGETSPAAVCFLTGLLGVGVYFAAAAPLPLRTITAVITLLPAAFFADGAGAVCAALTAAGALIADEKAPAESAVRTALTVGVSGLLMMTGAARALSGVFEHETPAGVLTVPISADNDSPMIEVSMDVPQAMYLHGFIGARYENGRWLAAAPADIPATHEQLLYLDKNGIDAQTQLYALSAADGAEIISVTVRDLAGDGFVCLPVTSSKCGDFPAGLALSGADSTVTVKTPADINGVHRRSDGDASQVLLGEIYQSVYLDIPDTTKHILEARFGNVTPGDLTAAADAAYKLSEELGYDRSVSGGLDDLLQKTRVGGSRQFASAAVMVFRYFGIPARYAEGCVIEPEQAAGKASGSPITVTESGRHAWAEYYLDGAGWLPFETVPYYLDTMPQPRGIPVGRRISGKAEDTQKTEREERSGSRPSKRITDEMKDQKTVPAWLKAVLTAAAAALIAGGVLAIRRILFARKLRRDPCLALTECAGMLGLVPDAAGRFDLNALDGLSGSLGRLQSECISATYGGGKVSCDPYAIYLRCKKYRVKRK